MSGWRLGIDFGTTNTVAAIARGEAVTLLDIESNGNSRMPSAVYLTDTGDILAGTPAVHQAVFAPDRYEPTPKRAIGEGEVFLGDQMVPVADLVAAVLGRVFAEASRQQAQSMPDEVVLTHPADWSETRLDVLREALQIANMPSATLVAEPVAAAMRLAASVDIGRTIAVYDFGGGTFDAAVLRRTTAGFDVAGPPAGRDPLGGEDVDQRIVSHIGELLGRNSPAAEQAWAQLMDPPDVAWRRHAAALRAEVQRAKETLSEVSAVQVWIPGLERDMQLTRAELDELIKPEIDATVDTVETVLKDADVRPENLAAIYLVGGSSRIPIAADALWRRFGIRPSVQDNPKAVVSLGAVTLPAGAGVDATARTARPDGSSGSTLVDSGPAFAPLLIADLRPSVWPAGSAAMVQLELDHPGSGASTIRLRDEPTGAGGTAELAEQVGRRRAANTAGWAETAAPTPSSIGSLPALERRFTMQVAQGTVAMVERYSVLDGRAVVLAFPEEVAALADQLDSGVPTPEGGVASRFSIMLPEGWTATERIAVRRNQTRHSVSIERVRHQQPVDAETWREHRIEQARARLGRALRSTSQGQLLGRLPGDITTLRWMRAGAPMLTKIGTAVHDRDAVAVTMTARFGDQALFGSLARHARLHPAAIAGVTR